MSWRGKLGIIYPADGALDSEYWEWVPEGVSVHINRFEAIDDQRVKVFEAQAKSSDIEKSASHLAVINPDSIAYACTSGSFVFGAGKDQEIITRMENESGVPCTTTSTAIVNALKTLQVNKLAVAAPYPQEVNDRLRVFLEQNGFSVVSLEGLGLQQGIFSQPPGTAYNLAKRANIADAEAVVISCTNFRTVDILEHLEKDLGKPVVSANQATVWELLRLGGVHEKLTRRGELFLK